MVLGIALCHEFARDGAPIDDFHRNDFSHGLLLSRLVVNLVPLAGANDTALEGATCLSLETGISLDFSLDFWWGIREDRGNGIGSPKSQGTSEFSKTPCLPAGRCAAQIIL
jgi:hypothetical protein